MCQVLNNAGLTGTLDVTLNVTLKIWIARSLGNQISGDSGAFCDCLRGIEPAIDPGACMPLRIMVALPKPPKPDPLPPGTAWPYVLISRVVTVLSWAAALAIVIASLRWTACF